MYSFRKCLGGVIPSIGESITTCENQSDVPDVQAHKSVRDTDRDSGLSGKERRNLRRNGTPVLSMKGTTEKSPSPAITSISASAFTCSSISGSSSSSSRDSNNGSGINSMGGRNGPRPSSKTVSVSSSTSITDQQILEKKRKQPSSSSPSTSPGLATGMFLNDVTSANSITDVDKRMGTTATKSSSSSSSSNKKQRR